MQLNKTLLAASIALLSLNAHGAAFQLGEHSAAGLGRAFAGEAAIAEDASVLARNPALMSEFTRNQVSLIASYVKPDVSLKGTGAPSYADASKLDDSSIAPSAIIPAGYMVMPINEQFAFGFGAFSNFGLSTEFADDYTAGQLAGQTEIVTVNMNASLSYKINEQFAIGGGLNYVYADAKIVRHFGTSPLSIPAQTEAARLEGDDYGFGWNLGVSYEPSEGHRFGLHYRSETDIKFAGEYSNQLPAQLGGLQGQSLPGRVEISLPAITEFSATHQLDQTIALHYSLMWTQWSSFDKLQAFVPGRETPVFHKQENFSNSWRYAIGADYQLNAETKLRAGIAYDKTPADKNHMSISIPDTNRLWLSAGANYQFSDVSSLDLGLSILRGVNRRFSETDNLGQVWQFESEGNAYLFAAQYNMAF
ncbi:outer membrane protein transport protein [Bowmanella yangjiangensis]|uniref:Outer membrane protein transport protein n=1 Tax=Bowmanella yangjiangensis TaxID=2811230 RepID=A0ABS3CV79_9ALTE|nr:outer membrane protein transport protein [Bowmanella yangjiangensis]MBN7819534.1 outer membrane protein transport protein [Bowmanella yangjiangensis]